MTWHLWIDTGGTFTDAVARDPQGNLKTTKILSNSTLRGTIRNQPHLDQIQIEAVWLKATPDRLFPADFFATAILRIASTTYKIKYFDPNTQTLTLDSAPTSALPIPTAFEIQFDEEAPILAARLITATAADHLLPPMQLRLATTRGTNALLEHKGTPTILFVTEGFADLLKIGNQRRPDLFTLNIYKPAPLTDIIIEIPERIAADGTVLSPIQTDALSRYLADQFQRLSINPADSQYSVAIALLNSHRNPTHEQILRSILQQFKFQNITTSSEVAPFIRYLQRTETTLVDAYLAPIIKDYLKRIAEPLDHSSRIFVMTSAGGLQSAQTYRAKDSLLSGPAGGVAGAAAAARRVGLHKIIAFDMGGTSTDVARFDHEFEYDFEHTVGPAHLMAPALAIHTVAAGGGSICTFDGQRLRVGPESAGAHPGPACYGRNGPLTLTDINLLLKRIIPRRFGIPIDRAAAQTALANLRNEINAQQPHNPITEAQLLQGCLDIANERMADAIRKISVRRGFEPAEYALTAFGGAGGQHACAVADRLKIPRIIIPESASLLSALGLGTAVVERIAEQQILQITSDLTDRQFQKIIQALTTLARQRVAEEGIPDSEIVLSRIILEARFLGQDSAIEVDLVPNRTEILSMAESETRFISAYRKIFNHVPEDHPIQFVTLRIMAASTQTHSLAVSQKINQTSWSTLDGNPRRRVVKTGRTAAAIQHFERHDIQPEDLIQGPALILEDHSVTVVENGWTAGVLENGTLMLERVISDSIPVLSKVGASDNASAEAVQLELFTNRFCALTEEMGEVLRRTALSTNVKERLDFSCALLDAEGELVVNAPHIPIHLGALGECVRQIRKCLDIQPGDVLITNHPAYGGSHLPDITVITPVFVIGDHPPLLLGYVANRAHHAEIGGTRPGSMPPDATTLLEEGVVIRPMHLIKQGVAQWKMIEEILTTQAPYPTRACLENLEDLRAAVAANHRGHEALKTLAQQYRPQRITHFMQALKQQAESKICAAFRRFDKNSFSALEFLDDGTPIQIHISVDNQAGTAAFDFTGSGAKHPGNLNATPAIVRSAVMYVLRLLINEPIPLNEGMMKPVQIILPENSFLNPKFVADPAQCPAVVGGNVETSQRIVDTLLKALNLAACSQGTMNNVLFGNEKFGYYETVAGGAGATPDAPGASAVHTHLTNTSITDPEIIEHRYPVRINRFAIREGSGGAGNQQGGDGIIREYEFLEEVQLSVLTQHRISPPYGQNGASAGKPGRQYILRRNSTEKVILDSIDQATLNPGDRLILKTPGGGGSGSDTLLPDIRGE